MVAHKATSPAPAREETFSGNRSPAAPLSRKGCAPVVHGLALGTAPLRAGLASVRLSCLLSQGRNALVQRQGQKFSHFIFFSLSLSALPLPLSFSFIKGFSDRWMERHSLQSSYSLSGASFLSLPHEMTEWHGKSLPRVQRENAQPPACSFLRLPHTSPLGQRECPAPKPTCTSFAMTLIRLELFPLGHTLHMNRSYAALSLACVLHH